MRSLADQLAATRAKMRSNRDEFADRGDDWGALPDGPRRARATKEQLAREANRLAAEQQRLEHKQRRAIQPRPMTLREAQLNAHLRIQRQLDALLASEQPEDALHYVTQSDLARRVAAPPSPDKAAAMRSALMSDTEKVELAVAKAERARLEREARRWGDSNSDYPAPF